MSRFGWVSPDRKTDRQTDGQSILWRSFAPITFNLSMKILLAGDKNKSDNYSFSFVWILRLCGELNIFF